MIKNYLLYFVVQAISFVLSPFVFAKYGAGNFGVLSLLFSWSMFGSYFFTMKTENALNRPLSKLDRQGELEKILGVYLIIGAPIYVLGIIVSLFIAYGYIFEILTLSFIIGLFNVVNSVAVVRGGLWFSTLHLIRVVGFYTALFIFPPNEQSVFFALVGGFVLAIAVFVYYLEIKINLHKIPNLYESFSYARKSTMFLFSFLVGSGREVFLVSYLSWKYGNEILGIYYLASMYMLKGALAYTTLQGNRIKFLVSNGDGRDFVRSIKMMGVLGILGYIGLASCYWLSEYSIGFSVSQALSLAPITVSFLLFAPFNVLYECYGLGKMNFTFNIISLLLLVLCCLLDVNYSFTAFEFIFLNSVVMFILRFIQFSYISRYHRKMHLKSNIQDD